MKLKKILFEEKGFRKLRNIEIAIAPGITAIAGHNGIGKSTILGLIANCSGVSRGKTASLFGKVFQSNFQEAFYLDYYEDFENYRVKEASKPDTPKVVLQYELADGSVIHKTCTVSTQKYRIKEKLYKSHMIKAAAVNRAAGRFFKTQ